ncbi:MAG: UDP-3-O-(3-hydroxymyristoyl)glucosamine N-acyltransferase, partial [Pirellulaceae bacterium]
MMTLQQIAEMVDGELLGDGSIEITGVDAIAGARAGDLTFAIDGKTMDKFNASAAAAAIVPAEATNCNKPHIKCADAKTAFHKIVALLRPPFERKGIGISAQAFISLTATIGEHVDIYPGAFVGDNASIGDGSIIHSGVRILEHCVIGRDVTIFPNAVLYEKTVIGDRTTIHGNAVIGAHGFGYDSDENGHRRGVQLGHVEIGADVDIGAATTIDRGTFGTTRVGNGCKLDNQVQIGHNCQIGEHNLLCSQVGIAGSSETESFVVLAGQVGVGDHIHIGQAAIVGAKGGVMHDLAGGQTWVGLPVTPAREQFQILAAQSK